MLLSPEWMNVVCFSPPHTLFVFDFFLEIQTKTKPKIKQDKWMENHSFSCMICLLFCYQKKKEKNIYNNQKNLLRNHKFYFTMVNHDDNVSMFSMFRCFEFFWFSLKFYHNKAKQKNLQSINSWINKQKSFRKFFFTDKTSKTLTLFIQFLQMKNKKKLID